MNIRKKVKEASDRELVTPGRDLRRYLVMAGWKDGRRNIPDLATQAWSTPIINELRDERHHGLGLLGADLFSSLAELDRSAVTCLARVARQKRSLQIALVDARNVEEELHSRPDIRLRRRLADAHTRVSLERQGLEAARAATANALIERADHIDPFRMRATAFDGFVKSATDIYWTANLRARKKRDLKGPQNVHHIDTELPQWVTSDKVFEVRDLDALRERVWEEAGPWAAA